MKLFQSLVRKVEQTHLRHVSRHWGECADALRQAVQSSKSRRRRLTPLGLPGANGGRSHLLHFLKENQLIKLDKQPSEQQQIACVKRGFIKKVSRSPVILVVAVLSLTSALGYRFYNTPKLDIGKAAPQTVYAPAAATIEDQKATEDNRKTARKDAISVLKLDQTINQQIQRSIHQQLQQGNDLRKLAGGFPYTSTGALSTRVQAYLRKLSESEWQSVLTSVDPSLSRSDLLPVPKIVNPSHPAAQNPERKQAIAELRNYRRSVDLGAYWVLIQEITEARLRYLAAIATLPQPVAKELSGSFYGSLLDLSDADWQQVRSKIPHIVERILAQGIPLGLPQSVLTEAVKLHVKNSLPPMAEPIANQLLLTLLQPNLIRDEEQTRLRAEQAALEIKPVMVSIRRGEAIVRGGKMITSADFALLEHFGLSRREIAWTGLIGFGLLVSGAVSVVWFVKQRSQTTLRRRDGVLLWLLSLSTPLLIALHAPSTNLPAVGLLASSFYGAPLGIAVTGLLTVLLGVGMEMQWSHLLSSAAAGLLCGWFGGRLRSREELALLGVAVGILQGTLYLLLNVASGAVWYLLLGASAFHGLLGLAWVIVGLGGSPYLEQLFDLVTTIRLVELANPNRPLLKRLAAEAPGTFQHTLFVATLAEAAARELGCNVELVRAGTLYHDIGKMHDPLGFIENQMGGPNKHDAINHPWKSAKIIKKHVTEGIVMARRARLPKAVQSFIPEHQGTMLIAYFYHQAQQWAQQHPISEGILPIVNESDFRYDGPVPQSRETGIVMLADSCEAALRSLKDATTEETLAMINKILRARWQDNQLIDSGLTREEMSQIATIFVQVWQQFNHQRIAYPKLAISPQPSMVRQ
ncbi:MAG: HDIG domain-containing protein [Leptolyngbyaceae cyanobacterium RU_5_1]|nr:HDIG domain-containing protein [Leptolyngbyaceae cyanobacterium RU_5_1]